MPEVYRDFAAEAREPYSYFDFAVA